MSQVAAPADRFETRRDFGNEFSYRPIPPAAPVALFLGICSFIALLTYIGIGVALLGIGVGIFAVRQIRRGAGEYSGKWLAMTGLVLSVLFAMSGTTLHAVTYATEVPEGFARVNFYHDISKKGIPFVNGAEKVHQDVQALDGKPIFLKGFMYPTKQTEGLTEFLLVKDSDQCCFGGQPKREDMIYVEMKEGQKVDYREGLVAVAGTFHVRAGTFAPTDNQPIYTIEGTHFERARTSF